MWSQPTIKHNPNFNAAHSAEMLHNAMKGLGCDKNKVIFALTSCNNQQRQEIARSYKTQYGSDLVNDLKKELSGDFENLIVALMTPHVQYDAQQLNKAVSGLGTKENILIEIMTTRSDAQIRELKQTYKQMFGKDLESDLVGDTSGPFQKLLVSLCTAGRDESGRTDPLKANQDARTLLRAGERKLGTDESTFNAILATQNYHQLRLVFDEYEKVAGHPIEKAIEAEFSGDIKSGFLAIIKSIRNRPAFFSELIHNSMKGLGTRDNDLIRLIVTRSEVDLGNVRNQFEQLYKTPLEKAIASECSGAYKEGLIQLVKGH